MGIKFFLTDLQWDKILEIEVIINIDCKDQRSSLRHGEQHLLSAHSHYRLESEQ